MRAPLRSFACLFAFCGVTCVPAAPARAQAVVHVRVDTTHAVASFEPRETFGGTVDKEPAGAIPRLYSPRNVRAMLDAGWGWLSYRLFTELSVQDWHWNPRGRFSAGDSGYWTSDAVPSVPIRDSFGYRLAHRGSTTDQGNNADYSRLDDGDETTYWKSNPYLAHAYTGDPDDAHPQWAVVDLGKREPVDAARIAWGQPFATRFTVEYWTGPDPIDSPERGAWQPFPTGDVSHGRGGVQTFRLTAIPLVTRFVRVAMSQSSNTCDDHGAGDRRNCVGYAIRELGVGTLGADGAFRDRVHHARCGGEKPGRYACGVRQSATYVSSVDPWHRGTERVRDQEQPGLDAILRSGLTQGLGAMYPVAMLYSTPENAVAELRYLEARRARIAYVELGEEPDGQYVLPEDYGALYVRWARALHAFDPSLKLGGPVFSGVNDELATWPDARGDRSWLRRFLAYLRAHGALGQLAFMSFEHYPYDGCEHGAALHADLLGEPALIAKMPRVWRADGLPRNVPMFVTEANFSAVNFTETPMRIEGALWLADYLVGAVEAGVARVVYYQDEPVPLSRNAGCPADWGNLAMFAAGEDGVIRARTAQFWAGRMLMHEWLAARGTHRLYRATGDAFERGAPLVSAYAVRRPDGTWALLIVNKDVRPHRLAVRFVGGAARAFAGWVSRVTFGPAQYVWRRRGSRSRPDPNAPPGRASDVAAPNATYRVPGRSLVVLSGRVAP